MASRSLDPFIWPPFIFYVWTSGNVSTRRGVISAALSINSSQPFLNSIDSEDDEFLIDSGTTSHYELLMNLTKFVIVMVFFLQWRMSLQISSIMSRYDDFGINFWLSSLDSFSIPDGVSDSSSLKYPSLICYARILAIYIHISSTFQIELLVKSVNILL